MGDYCSGVFVACAALTLSNCPRHQVAPAGPSRWAGVGGRLDGKWPAPR
jgi:hypothetical protein